MKTFPLRQLSSVAVAALLLNIASMPVLAKTPNDVADLVGAKGAGGEMELEQRGYANVTMTRGVQYWWNDSSQSCIGIKVAQGRYKSIAAASAAQCKQSTAAASKSSKPSTQAAESACMEKINGNYGGKVNDLKVVRAEFSQANTEVIVDAIGIRGESTTERWRCLAASNGQVADLSVMQ